MRRFQALERSGQSPRLAKEEVANNFTISKLQENDDRWPGTVERARVANACESQGTLRFAPATLTHISRDVIARELLRA
jgi:hypothetical protein